MLHKLQELAETIIASYRKFEFHSIYQAVYNFCVLTLSSFYLDILKDRLYTSAADSRNRRSAQTTMNEILECLVRLVAPIIPFTADEVWKFSPNTKKPFSIHLDLFLPVKEDFKDDALIERWEKLLNIRKEITRALELARKDKVVGHPLDAAVSLALPQNLLDDFKDYEDELKNICIVSNLKFVEEGGIEGGYKSEEFQGLSIKISTSPFDKCERCWIHDSTVGDNNEHPVLCKRCVEVVKEIE